MWRMYHCSWWGMKLFMINNFHSYRRIAYKKCGNGILSTDCCRTFKKQTTTRHFTRRLVKTRICGSVSIQLNKILFTFCAWSMGLKFFTGKTISSILLFNYKSDFVIYPEMLLYGIKYWMTPIWESRSTLQINLFLSY